VDLVDAGDADGVEGEDRTGWSIKFVRTARRYRTIKIRAGQQIPTAEDPIPPDLSDALALIT
jgi:hypothetical protein